MPACCVFNPAACHELARCLMLVHQQTTTTTTTTCRQTDRLSRQDEQLILPCVQSSYVFLAMRDELVCVRVCPARASRIAVVLNTAVLVHLFLHSHRHSARRSTHSTLNHSSCSFLLASLPSTVRRLFLA